MRRWRRPDTATIWRRDINLKRSIERGREREREREYTHLHLDTFCQEQIRFALKKLSRRPAKLASVGSGSGMGKCGASQSLCLKSLNVSL